MLVVAVLPVVVLSVVPDVVVAGVVVTVVGVVVVVPVRKQSVLCERDVDCSVFDIKQGNLRVLCYFPGQKLKRARCRADY